MSQCKSIGCEATLVSTPDMDYCKECLAKSANYEVVNHKQPSMSELYPKYYKNFEDVSEADVYLVHDRFGLHDFSGALHHASKKILLSGVRTGGKTKFDDIREARDALNRWLEINKQVGT